MQNAYQVVIYETYHNKLGKGEVDKKDYSFTDMLGTFLESGSYEVIPAEGYNSTSAVLTSLFIRLLIP